MILTEISSIPSGSLPFYNLKNHLRMGTTFSETDLQDPLLEAYLRAAISTIENALGIALIARNYSWHLTAWRDGKTQGLPLRPINSIVSITKYDKQGTSSLIDSSLYSLKKDMQSSQIISTLAFLPTVDAHGSVEIIFEAGFGNDWEDLPADLAQAVILLAAHFYEFRTGALMPNGTLPMSVLALIEPYRAMRISGRRG
jgi:uncharacterized phiE125 gp8 family phage protein